MNARYLPKEKLRNKLEVYLSAAEKNLIAQKARETGLPVSSFIRRAALGQKLETVPLANVEKWRELARLAANLNQIAHAINGGRAAGVDPNLIAQLGDQVRFLRLDLTGGVK